MILARPMSAHAVLGLLAALAFPNASAAQDAALYNETCAACHGDAGEGAPGFAPPLVGTEIWMHPGTALDQYFAAVVLHGNRAPVLIGKERFQGMMPPQDSLSDSDLLVIAEYVFRDLNGVETTLTVDDFAQMRDTKVQTGAMRSKVLE